MTVADSRRHIKPPCALGWIYSPTLDPKSFLRALLLCSSGMPSRPITSFYKPSATAVLSSLYTPDLYPGGRVGSNQFLVGDLLTRSIVRKLEHYPQPPQSETKLRHRERPSRLRRLCCPHKEGSQEDHRLRTSSTFFHPKG